MNIFKRNKKQVEQQPQPNLLPIEERAAVYSPYSDFLSFGKVYNNESAMKLSAVYRATEIISDAVACLPIKIKQNTDNSQDELFNHPLNLVFKNGLDRLDKYTFMKMLIQSVILRGNGYALIERDKSGNITGLRYVESSDVTIVYNKQPNILYYTCSLAKPTRVEPENMIHLVKNSYDGINGISVLANAKRIIEISSNTENSAKTFFSNGCNLAGVITVQGQLSEKQKQDIRTNWASTFNGTDTGGCVLGVLQGNMDYKPIQISSSDSQMLESREFNVKDIARFFGISPIMLGDYSNASPSSIEATQTQFYLQTLMPYIIMVENEFTRKLLKNTNLEINLDENYILRTDKINQANYYKTLLDTGILSINEVRKELGYSEVNGLDKHIIAYTDISQNTINQDNDDSNTSKRSRKVNKK